MKGIKDTIIALEKNALELSNNGNPDCFYLKDLEEEGHDFESLYGDVTEQNHTYEIGYLIGDEEYLNKGIGKMIIQILEEKIIELGGCEIAADPSEDNILSIKALISNEFKKKGDGDYRKITENRMSN